MITATSLRCGKGRNSTPDRIKTPSLIDIKFRIYDDVRGVWPKSILIGSVGLLGGEL